MQNLTKLLKCLQSLTVAPSSETIPWPRPVLSSLWLSIPTACSVLSHSFTALRIWDSAQLSPSSISLNDPLRPKGSLPPLTMGLLCSSARYLTQVFPNFIHHSCAFFSFHIFPLPHKLVFHQYFSKLSHILLNHTYLKRKLLDHHLLASLLHP